MIWKAFGTVGAITFFISSFTIIGNPDCNSVDIGGGRVIGVTCYTHSYGAFSQGVASGLMFLIGIALLLSIYWRGVSNFFQSSGQISKPARSNKSEVPIGYENWVDSKYESKSKNLYSTDKTNAKKLDYKTCDNCNHPAQLSKSWCGNCSGTSFTQKEVLGSALEKTLTSEEAMSEAFEVSKDFNSVQVNPETKTCPMCAEEIKYAAKKCRYCQHMLDA